MRARRGGRNMCDPNRARTCSARLEMPDSRVMRRPRKPKPDPDAPKCPKCAETGERKRISIGPRFVNAVVVGRGSFYDEEGTRHSHSGSAGGKQSYSCACGHRWSEQLSKTYHPCWCGWPKSPSKERATG